METFNPKIWRSSYSNFNHDEPLNASKVYSDDVFKKIREDGFDSIWMRGRLYDLMESTIFPELNRPRANERVQSLREVIQRGKKWGVGVWLFFNEPLAVPSQHSFWKNHQEIRGVTHREPYCDPVWHEEHLRDHLLEPVQITSICQSTSRGRNFFAQAVRDVLQKLDGLGGVILITSSEHHSHCWSHQICLPTGDKYAPLSKTELSCEACRERGAADVVLNLLKTWRDESRDMKTPCRVLAWNWSWSFWYPDPQAEIVGRLPDGVELLADCERGDNKPWRGRIISIDEYSIGFVGPSRRFLGSLQVAGKTPIHAKLQINVTHELATVPNLPLISNLYRKWNGLRQRGVRGVMGCWNFGSCSTLNTFAFRQFEENTEIHAEEKTFLDGIARSYFGLTCSQKAIQAWNHFEQSFELYPFSVDMLYHSPINYSVAYPLSLSYRGDSMGPSWLPHEWGERLEDTLLDWPIEDVIASWKDMAILWEKGLVAYRDALSNAGTTETEKTHCREELSCAEMIGCHLTSVFHIYQFHHWRNRVIKKQGLNSPCSVLLDAEGCEIVRLELANAQRALKYAESDARFGFHEEPQVYFYTADRIRKKIEQMKALSSLELQK